MGQASGITVEKILGYFEGGYRVGMAEDCSLSAVLNGDLLEALAVQKYQSPGGV